MDCRDAHERLNAYLDGELPPETAAQVRQHLSACPQCAQGLADLERLNRAIGTLAGAEAPADFARRVRMAAEDASVRSGIVRLSDFLMPGRVHARIAAAAVAAAGVLLGVAMGGSVSPEQALAGETTTAELEGFDLHVDPLSAAPAGSVTEVYLAFAGETQ